MFRRKQNQEITDGNINFSRRMEHQAKRISKKTSCRNREMSPLSVLEKEIALTVDHIEQLRNVKSEQLDSLLQMEVYTNTELMQMEARTPKYSPYRFPEHEKLQRRFLKIEEERRHLSLTHEEKIQNLHDRLLSLLNKHSQLNL